MAEEKLFRITEEELVIAYKRVKVNRCAGDINGIVFEYFEHLGKIMRKICINYNI
ncbi:hypothetical protein H04402_00603 [Clostridium botulinum H04402 065]|uniref:hypothetical protein n=1 Tax=Clostridium botulinum TaxID=1491 RepID=UPI0001F84ECA|nr:hypothetical protein [Clostridium botulinum]CBZ02413.1 hypothetical protein H04402_00603 [Clostridium botulinum H04402 065]